MQLLQSEMCGFFLAWNDLSPGRIPTTDMEMARPLAKTLLGIYHVLNKELGVPRVFSVYTDFMPQLHHQAP